MSKLKEINGYVRLTLDKLPGIRTDLARLDDNWQEWDLANLVDSLRRWTDRSPENILNNDQKHKRENVFQTKEQKQLPYACVYCDKQGQKASQCESVKSVEDRRLILSKKKRCFNCTGTKHIASAWQEPRPLPPLQQENKRGPGKNAKVWTRKFGKFWFVKGRAEGFFHT